MRRLLFLAALALYALLVGGATGGQASGEKLPTIRYAYFKAWDPTFVAIDKGFFKKAGVNVALTGSFPSGPASVAAAGAGQVDSGLCAVTGLVGAVAHGVGVLGVADSQTEFKSAPLQRFYVKAGSDIASVKDLKGKRVAVNSLSGSFYYAALVALHSAGLEASDVKWQIMPIPLQEQALVSGQIDAAGLIDPFNVKAEKDGGVRLLFRAVDYTGERHVSLIFFTRDYIAKHDKAVRAFVKGYRQAIAWSKTHRTQSLAIQSKYVGVPGDLFAKHSYTLRTRVKFGDIRYWLAFMRQEGALKDDGRLTPASIATIRYTGGPPKHR